MNSDGREKTETGKHTQFLIKLLVRVEPIGKARNLVPFFLGF